MKVFVEAVKIGLFQAVKEFRQHGSRTVSHGFEPEGEAIRAIGDPEKGIYIDSRKHIARRKGGLGTVRMVMSNRFETV